MNIPLKSMAGIGFSAALCFNERHQRARQAPTPEFVLKKSFGKWRRGPCSMNFIWSNHVKYGFLFIMASLVGLTQEINLKKIMDDPAWIGALPDNVNLSSLDRAVYFQTAQPITAPQQLMRYDIDSGELTQATDETRPYAFASPHLKGNLRIIESGGDLWISRDNKPMEPLISQGGNLSFIRFIDQSRFIFREGKNLFLMNPDKGSVIQLTDLVEGDEPEEDDPDFYQTEERKMFRYIDNLYLQEENDEARMEARRRMGSLIKPSKTWLGKSYRISGRFSGGRTVDISDDLQYVAITMQAKKEGDPTDYAEFVNKDGNVVSKKSRPRVGIKAKDGKLGVLNRQDGTLTWLDVSDLPEIAEDRLADIKESLSEEDKKFLPKEKEGPRPVSFYSGGFRPGGTELLVTAVSKDDKDIWIFLVDPATMKTTMVEHHHDPAWILSYMSGYGFSNSFSSMAGFWRRDGKKVMFLSDKTGYTHLYSYDLKKAETNALTEGNFEVYSPEESSDGKQWYFHANKAHPGEIHYYSIPIDGGKWKTHTSGEGRHETGVSEDGTWMVQLFSKTNQPPVLQVRKKDGKWKTVYDGRSEAFKAIKWVEPEVVAYKNRDGGDVYARIYKPENPNGAGVVFVHGAGYLQNAHKGWSGYFREYMFHNLLLRQGYTILDPDYQASAGYGRDWRTAIYRHMGGADLNDIVDGANYLVNQHGVEANRVGLYGGSYGGFIALMAMFTTPDVFQSGAALRPVTDWAYYNHPYTSRILNLPANDPVAYRRSSPIYFAEGLKGHLLICHGMVDSNVYYQDSVRLAQKLIELRKHNWELSSYPVEGHGFTTPSGWYDEYRRIYELFERTLK